MKALSVLLLGLLLSPPALAKPPPSGAYVVAPSGDSANGSIQFWIDETDTTLNPWGTPHPVSTSEPLPVAIVSGGTGGGSTGGSVTAPGTNGTNAQAVQGITGGVPMAVNGTVGPTTGLVTRCQGGTGSNVTTVTTTPSVICAGGSGTIRSYFNISFTSGTYSGTPLGWCSMQTVAGDNAPTQTGGDFPIQGIATSFNNGGNGTVQGNAIMCVATSAAGSISVIPTVVQTGVAP
jgi:hypothetical protein